MTIRLFLILFCSSLSFAALAKPRQVILPDEAKEIAEKAYKKHRNEDDLTFSCRLIEETDKLWAFGCENITTVPGPGAAVFINVKKLNGKVVVYPGK